MKTEANLWSTKIDLYPMIMNYDLQVNYILNLPWCDKNIVHLDNVQF